MEGYENIVSNCIFINNSAYIGGALYMTGSGNNCTVSNCIFTDNEATAGNEGGGAIYVSRIDNAVVSGCIFTGNSANRGGAIYWVVTDGSVSGCIFVNNSATNATIYIHDVNHMEWNRFTINYNIFLNNQANPLTLNQKKVFDYNFDDNWFGNNATNYDVKPVDYDIESWLFLNSTVNPDILFITDALNISFELYGYNSFSNYVFECDESRLYPINLTINSTNGKVNKNTVGFGETITYTPSALGTGTVTASIENAVYTIEFNIVKANSTLTVDDMIILQAPLLYLSLMPLESWLML